MKYFFVLLAAIVGLICNVNSVLNNNVKLLVRPKLNQCAKDLGVSQKDEDAVINNDLSNTSTPLQCLALCFFQALGMMDSEGHINVIASKLLFSLGERPCKVNSIVNACKNIKGNSPCNTAYLINKCYVQHGLL